MALLFDAVPTTSGTPYGVAKFYVDVMFIAPHGTEDLEVRLDSYVYEESPSPSVGSPLPNVDGIHNVRFPGEDIITNDFWTDINAGNVHDEVIRILEEEKPEWAGKIQKILPLPSNT